LTNSSVTSRFTVSALANLLRGALAFITTLIIARELGPEEYGSFAFLVGTFVATTSLLGFGTSHAFQTFISQKERGKMFVFTYACWQFLQFILALLFIGVIFPENWLEQIWLGHKKDLILLALAAVFMQQQAWATMIKIGESKRLTHIVQGLNLAITVVHFFLIIGFLIGGFLSVRLILWLILVEHLIILLIACKALSLFKIEGEVFEGRLVLQEYIAYCSPLIFFSIIGFGYNFADRWLLQSYGGSIQQGLYEIGLRLGMVSLLITMSLQNIFWKEIAEAKEKGDFERMRVLYRKASRFLFAVGIFIAGFLAPWSKEIIRLVLGPSYMEGSLVLVVMFIYAAFRSLGILNSSMLLAGSKPKVHVTFSTIFMIISIPTSYLVLAPIDAQLPGLQLGSLGLAIKTLVVAISQSSVVSWWICRDYGWKFDWIYQLIVLSFALSFGWLSFELVQSINSLITLNLFCNGLLTLLFYSGFFTAMVYWMPWILGVSRQELKYFFLKLVNLSRA
jgi:O-antigen/teichoic acid export membrane protein